MEGIFDLARDKRTPPIFTLDLPIGAAFEIMQEVLKSWPGKEKVKAILRGLQVHIELNPFANVPGKQMKHRLREAWKKADWEFVELLLNCGVQPDSRLPWVHLATLSLSCLRVLLDRGSDPNAKCDCMESTCIACGRTPLHTAARFGNEDTVRLLLDRGADINAVCGEDGQMPLHEAGCEKEAVFRLLLDRGTGADVNAASDSTSDPDGRTPLHEAAAGFGTEGVVRLLLERGAEINVQMKRHGPTPLDEARRCSRWGAARVLMDHGAR